MIYKFIAQLLGFFSVRRWKLLLRSSKLLASIQSLKFKDLYINEMITGRFYEEG